MKELLRKLRILPLATLHERAEAERALSALAEGGMPLVEIALRTEYAEEAIAYAAKNFPSVAVGAGTVLDAAQAERAIGAGASFLVSPGFSADVLRVCRAAGLFYLPGCATPTEIMRAADAGLDTVKFFPANVYGGAKAVKALAAPFRGMRFVPTGGVNLQNLGEYLALDAVLAAGGGFVLEGDVAENLRRIGEIAGKAKGAGAGR